jgi:hypothetical protein
MRARKQAAQVYTLLFLMPIAVSRLYRYSYLTASIRVNATRLLTDPVFTSNVYSGSAQLFLLYNYASTSSLQSGKWPQDDPVSPHHTHWLLMRRDAERVCGQNQCIGSVHWL